MSIQYFCVVVLSITSLWEEVGFYFTQHNHFIVSTYGTNSVGLSSNIVITDSFPVKNTFGVMPVFPHKPYFESASRDGLETFHLYEAKRRMSAQDEFILYDFLGWMVSFCTVSISKASSSWSNTWKTTTTTKCMGSVKNKRNV